MSDNVLTAIISAGIALLTAGATAYFARGQSKRDERRLLYEMQRERGNWLKEIKSQYSLDLLTERLKTYPEAMKIIGELSVRAAEPMTPAKAHRIAGHLNAWIYSAGGLCATKETRGALLGLREACFRWESGSHPPELYAFRDISILMLRRDLDLKGLESYSFDNLRSALDELRQDVEELQSSGEIPGTAHGLSEGAR